MKKIVLLLLCLVACVYAEAYTVKGLVKDTAGEPLISASVRLLAARDSTAVKGAVCDSEGRFIIKDVKAGWYLLETGYVGFDTRLTPLRVRADVDAGTITLSESSIMLRETVVTGIKTPITVKEDTVEFNADTYKTRPNAVVEDLLKRLPGVEVSSDGSITANGKSVSKILVDGKEFFSDDPTVASRNLPVDMVDKLQVVQRKSDLARLTGVDDGEDETVINLTVKKGMNNGWFGTVEGGYGTDDRYKGSFNVNRFWDGNQVTIIGGANNVNDLGFTDGTSGRFRRFGGTTGVTASQALGVNFNVGRDERLRFGGDVMYSRSDRDTRQSTEREYLFADSTSYYSSYRRARDIGNNLRADLRVLWQPDSFNTVDFRPNFSYNHSNSWSVDTALTRAGNASRTAVTASRNRDNSRGDSWEAGGRLIYNHKFRSRPGRAFSLFANYRFSDVREYSSSYSWNKFYLLQDSVDLTDRYTDNRNWSNNVSARLSWTEPIGDVRRGNFITVAYRVQYRWNNADRLTYDHPVDFPGGWDADPVIGSDLVFSDELSNRFRNDFFNQDIRAGFKHTGRTHTIDVGASLVPSRSKSTDLINSARNIPERWVWNYAPYLRYRWRRGKSQSINIDYFGRSSQPSMSQLQPVADMTNPLQIVVGNPELDPSFTHGIRMRYSDFNQKAQRSVMAMVFANVHQNSIVSRTTFDPTTGGRITSYTNVNGVWDVRAMNMVSFPLANKSWTVNNHLMLYYSRAVGFNNGERNIAGTFNFDIRPALAFRPESAEIELRPRYSLSTVHNSLQTASGRTVHTYGAALNGTYYTPFGLVLNTDLDFSATSGYSQGYDQRVWMWNATLSYQLLRGRNLTLSLRAYDLLRQNSNVRRSISANYIDDVRTNSLGQYFMFTVAYKFTTFAAGEQPKDRNADRFGPGGPPPGAPRGGGHPGGRPPF